MKENFLIMRREMLKETAWEQPACGISPGRFPGWVKVAA